MESGLLSRIIVCVCVCVWEKRDPCHDIEKKADCQQSKKRVIAHLWFLAVVSQQKAFFTYA